MSSTRDNTTPTNNADVSTTRTIRRRVRDRTEYTTRWIRLGRGRRYFPVPRSSAEDVARTATTDTTLNEQAVPAVASLDTRNDSVVEVDRPSSPSVSSDASTILLFEISLNEEDERNV